MAGIAGSALGSLGSTLGGGESGGSSMMQGVASQAKFAQMGVAAGKAQSEIAIGAATEQAKQAMETSTAMASLKNANDLNDAVVSMTKMIGSSAKSAAQ
jgi:hypothetical protein